MNIVGSVTNQPVRLAVLVPKPRGWSYFEFKLENGVASQCLKGYWNGFQRWNRTLEEGSSKGLGAVEGIQARVATENGVLPVGSSRGLQQFQLSDLSKKPL